MGGEGGQRVCVYVCVRVCVSVCVCVCARVCTCMISVCICICECVRMYVVCVFGVSKKTTYLIRVYEERKQDLFWITVDSCAKRKVSSLLDLGKGQNRPTGTTLATMIIHRYLLSTHLAQTGEVGHLTRSCAELTGIESCTGPPPAEEYRQVWLWAGWTGGSLKHSRGSAGLFVLRAKEEE